MKVMQLLTFFYFITISTISQAHALKCMACGKTTEGNETIYTGICKHEDDMGESRECDQIGYESASCISLVLDPYSGSYMTTYMKNCYPTPFHLTGCLDIKDKRGTGIQCYCSNDDCNSSYGTTTSPSSRVTSPPTSTTTNEGSTTIGDIIIPIIIVIVNLCFQVFE